MLGESHQVATTTEPGGQTITPWTLSELQAIFSRQVMAHFGGDVIVYPWRVDISRGTGVYKRFEGIASSKDEVLEQIANALRDTPHVCHAGPDQARQLQGSDFLYGLRYGDDAKCEVKLRNGVPFKTETFFGETWTMFTRPTMASEVKLCMELMLD